MVFVYQNVRTVRPVEREIEIAALPDDGEVRITITQMSSRTTVDNARFFLPAHQVEGFIAALNDARAKLGVQ